MLAVSVHSAPLRQTSAPGAHPARFLRPARRRPACRAAGESRGASACFSVLRRVRFAAATLCALASAAAGAPPIGVFDLTYALQFDPKNPRQVAAAWDHAHAVATLQGNVNRTGPRLYVRFVTVRGRNVDDYWWDRMAEPGRWLAGRRMKRIPDITALVSEYRSLIQGAVVYDPAVPATSNLASTIAGAENGIAIRYDPSPESLYTRLVTGGPKLPVLRRLLNADGSPMFTGRGTIPGTDVPSTGSAKCDAYVWLRVNYIDTGRVDAGFAGYYVDAAWQKNPAAAWPNHHTLTNHDFFVAKRGFFFDLSNWGDEAPVDDPHQPPGADLRTLRSLLRSAYEHGGRDRMIHIGGFTPWVFKYTNHPGAGGRHGGVATEWDFVRTVSAYNAFVDGDAIEYGAMANASFWMHFPLRKSYPQRWVTPADLKRRGYLTPDNRVNLAGRQFVLFYVGDYDSAAWLYQLVPHIWDRPDRGKVPMMWCVSPVIERRAPMALDYMRRTATKNDYFAAADNGAGYLNPGMLQEPRAISGLPGGLDAWGRHCKPFYQRWGLTITGFIIDGDAPGLDRAGLDCYAAFSPNGIVPQKIPLSLLHGDMPVLRADYDVDAQPDDAVRIILERIRVRPLPFHWFRNVLKAPEWYTAVHARLKAADPKIELLDAPTFFELYRLYLKENPKAASGQPPH
ncbi:MAG: hypothetical protein ACPMAQ_10830 [Phycisphaerae bacterium]